MLFTEFARTNDKPKSERESDFVFFDRSARPEMQRVRELLDQLIEGYPTDGQAELQARIRSGNDVDFKSATFELIVFSFLTRLGYKLQPHPELANGSSKLPDFRVVSPDGSVFFLEAVLASSKNGANLAADAMIATTLDALYLHSHHNFRVEIGTEGSPQTQPSGRKLLAKTLAWLDSLDPDVVIKIFEGQGPDGLPVFLWRHENLKILLRPIPISSEKRGTAESLVGVLDGGVGIEDQWTPIRDQIKFKGGRYGDLGAPLLIAVNFGSFHLERIDELQALFGQEELVFSRDRSSAEPVMRRAPNGVWHGHKGPQSRRASGAWIFNDLRVHNISSRRQTIYFNPWAFHPLPDSLKQIPHARLAEKTMRWQDGASLKEVFGLPDDWP